MRRDYLIKNLPLMTLIILVVFHRTRGAPGCTGFQCVADHTCFRADQRCDGVEQCNDGSDERDCHLNEEICTSKGMYFCSFAKTCVGNWEICDFNCPKEFSNRCKSRNQCFSNGQRCNRIFECTDETDEASCLPTEYNEYLSGPGNKADRMSINGIVIFVGPIMASTALLLFVLKLRASSRSGPRRIHNRQMILGNVNPVLSVTEQSSEPQNIEDQVAFTSL